MVSEIIDFTESVRSLGNRCTCDAHVLMPGPKQKAQAFSPALSASGRGDAFYMYATRTHALLLLLACAAGE